MWCQVLIFQGGVRHITTKIWLNVMANRTSKTCIFCPSSVKMVQIAYFVVVFIMFEPQMVLTSIFHQFLIIGKANRLTPINVIYTS